MVADYSYRYYEVPLFLLTTGEYNQRCCDVLVKSIIVLTEWIFCHTCVPGISIRYWSLPTLAFSVLTESTDVKWWNSSPLSPSFCSCSDTTVLVVARNAHIYWHNSRRKLPEQLDRVAAYIHLDQNLGVVGYSHDLSQLTSQKYSESSNNSKCYLMIDEYMVAFYVLKWTRLLCES